MDSGHSPWAIQQPSFPLILIIKENIGCLSAKVASIPIKSVPIFGFYWYEPSLAPADWEEGTKTAYGMFEPLSKVPYSFAALTSRCGNVIARTHHRFEYSRQTKSGLNSLTQKVSSLTEREDSKVLLPAHDINLGPRATFYKTRRFHLVITREWLFYFAKTSVIGKRMGGHGYLNITIFRNGCNLSPKKENRYCKKQ